MTIWAVLPAYNRESDIYYQVLPYSLRGTIKYHFEFYKGFLTLLPFLWRCRLTKEKANKLAKKLERK